MSPVSWLCEIIKAYRKCGNGKKLVVDSNNLKENAAGNTGNNNDVTPLHAQETPNKVMDKNKHCSHHGFCALNYI